MSSTAVAEIIDPDISVDLVHTLADADFCGEMHDKFHALNRFRHGICVADVAIHDFDRSQHRIGRSAPAVNLFNEAV